MGEPDPTAESDEPYLDSQGVPRSKSYLEKRKLDLEITNLEKKNKWEAFLPVIPPVVSVVTVLLGVIGIGFSFWQVERQQDKWLSEQELQRTAKEDERTAQQLKQLRSDVDEISKFTQDKTQTLSRVSFLLADVDMLVDAGSQNEDARFVEVELFHGAGLFGESELFDKTVLLIDPVSQTFHRYKETLTEVIVEQIVYDADFIKNPRDVIFANKIVEDRADYRDYMQAEKRLNTLNDILYRYIRALRYIRDQNLSYYRKVDYNEKFQRYSVSGTAEKMEGEENLFQHIRNILEGFKKNLSLLSEEHLDLLSDKPRAQEIKKTNIQEFGKALCRESIGRHILGNDYEYLGDDFKYSDCTKP